MKCKQAFMYGPFDLRIEEVELPPLKDNQVLIKLKACGICGSDVECFEGKSAEGRYDIAPYTPGHEWAGQVAQIGSAVTSLKPGDKVVGDCVLPCFQCANCKDGKMPSACLNMREVGFRPDSPGGFGEYMILEEAYTHKIPDDWDYELGAWVETFNVGYWGVWGNGCCPDASDDVAIIGGGPIGLTAAMVCKTANAHVIVIDPLEERRKNALNYGADDVVDPTEGDLEQKIDKCSFFADVFSVFPYVDKCLLYNVFRILFDFSVLIDKRIYLTAIESVELIECFFRTLPQFLYALFFFFRQRMSHRLK